MKRRPIYEFISEFIYGFPKRSVLRGLLLAVALVVASPGCVAAEPAPAAISTFNSYVNAVEARLAQQHRSDTNFLASADSDPQSDARLRRGELIVERISPAAGAELPGAMLHDWRGTAFVPGAKAADFERLMKDFSAYPQHFAPQVLQARVLTDRKSTRLNSSHLGISYA